MTDYDLKISEEEKDLLNKILDNLIRKAKTAPSQFLEQGILLEQMSIKLKDAKAVEKKIAKKNKVSDEFLPNLCPDHPTYNAKSAPRIDCEGHWEAYKKLHPLEYDKARQNFDRQQSSKK